MNQERVCPPEDIYAMNFRSLGSIALCLRHRGKDVFDRTEGVEMTSTFPKTYSEVTDEHTRSAFNVDGLRKSGP